MTRAGRQETVLRYDGNPIITLDDLPFACTDICNAGAVRVGGEYVLLITVHNLEGDYAIHCARSTDGYRFTVEETPFLAPSQDGEHVEFEEMGVLDARINPLEDCFYITYDALGRHGYCMALACTKDFRSVSRMGIVAEPDNKAGVLFPRKIQGRYVRLERPWSGASIWVNYSDDLVFWGGAQIVMTPRSGFWDPSRIGPATPPIEVDQGWLILYEGIKDTSAGPLFRLGAAVLDRNDPAFVVGRTNVPVLTPRMPYERIGDVPNLVFSCGAVLESEDKIQIYYGAADSCICLATASISDIVNACLSGEVGAYEPTRD